MSDTELIEQLARAQAAVAHGALALVRLRGTVSKLVAMGVDAADARRQFAELEAQHKTRIATRDACERQLVRRRCH